MPGALAASSALTLSKEAREAAPAAWTLSLPTAGEFFAAVSKQERPNWGAVQRADFDNRMSDRSQIALSLGVLFADAYLAIERQDGQIIRNIMRDIVSQAEKLHAAEGLLARERNINTFAERNNWRILGTEVDATQNEIILLLQAQNDQNLVPLIGVGEWLRAFNVFTTLQRARPQMASLPLLIQPSLVKSQLDLLSDLPQKGVQNMWHRAALSAFVTMQRELSKPNDPPLLPVTPQQLELASQGTSSALAVIGGLAQRPETAENDNAVPARSPEESSVTQP
ncbi:MAG: hypothetical protein ACK5NG_04955 [Chthoniobacterales bacterium]